MSTSGFLIGSWWWSLVSTVGDCGKTERKTGSMECSNIGAHKVTYDAIELEKGEKSLAVRSYTDGTREDVQTPLG